MSPFDPSKALDAAIEYGVETSRLMSAFAGDAEKVREFLSQGKLKDAGAPEQMYETVGELMPAGSWESFVALGRHLRLPAVPQVESCWKWSGAHGTNGRPVVTVNGYQRSVYRALWGAVAGWLDPLYDLDHRCVGTLKGSCANPWHCQVVDPTTHRALTLVRAGMFSPLAEEYLRAKS